MKREALTGPKDAIAALSEVVATIAQVKRRLVTWLGINLTNHRIVNVHPALIAVLPKIAPGLAGDSRGLAFLETQPMHIKLAQAVLSPATVSRAPAGWPLARRIAAVLVGVLISLIFPTLRLA